jgi:hypothetical protein
MPNFSDTLAKVKKYGYWRVVLHPTGAPRELIPTLPKARQLLTQSAVSLTGWDYPHVPQSENDRNSIYSLNDRIEAWTDFDIHKEVLRFYNSGLFAHLMAVREDWYSDDMWLPSDHPLKRLQPGTVMDFLVIIYQVTEMLIFLRNLVQIELYPQGVVFTLELHGTENRELTTFDPRRAFFGKSYVARGKEICLPSRTYSALEVLERHLQIAEDYILQIFHRFNWERATSALIQEEQRRLLERRL